MDIEIRRLGPDDEHAVHAAAALFDRTPDRDATRRFLDEPTHHLLIAYDGDAGPLGFVSGVETTHPDKGTEMFLYELGVDEPTRRRGVGSALVEALAALAQERGCYGMWVDDRSRERRGDGDLPPRRRHPIRGRNRAVQLGRLREDGAVDQASSPGGLAARVG